MNIWIYYYYENPFQLKSLDEEFEYAVQHFHDVCNDNFIYSIAIMSLIDFEKVDEIFEKIGKIFYEKMMNFNKFHYDLVILPFTSLVLKNLSYSVQFIPELEITSIRNTKQILNVIDQRYQNLLPGIMKQLNDVHFKFR